VRGLTEGGVRGHMSELTSKLGQGLHVAFDLTGNLVFRDFQVIAGLKVHPKRRAVAEITRKAESGIRSNPTTLVDNVSDAGHGDRGHGEPWPFCSCSAQEAP